MDVKELNDTAIKLANTRISRLALEEEAAELKKEESALEIKLSDALIEAGHDQLKLTGVGTFSRSVSTYWNVTNNTVALEYFGKTAPEMIKISPQAVRGWANKQKENDPNWDPSQAGLESYDKTRINFRRA